MSGSHATRLSEPRALKQDRAHRTKAVILQAAAEIFAETGYPTVTLQDVAERAEVTKGAVYFHFANKEALALEVIRKHYERWRPLISEAEERGEPPLETLFFVLDGTLATMAADVMVQAGIRLQIERSLIGADLPRPLVDWYDELEPLVCAAQDGGQLRADMDPRAFTLVLVASFLGVQHFAQIVTQREDLHKRWAETRDLLFRGVLA